MPSQNTANTVSSRTEKPPDQIEFVRLTTEDKRKQFYQSLTGSRWWLNGGKKDFDRGWVEIFRDSKWKCVYCDRDLATSTDALAESTEEHLVPRSLLEPNGVSPNTTHNMAACCSGCNGLKSEFVPPANHPCWQTRKAYIKECCRFIASRRLANFKKYVGHVERVLQERLTQ